MPLNHNNVEFIAIHCSASPPDVYVDAKVIDRWHRMKGFFKIGYHFVLKRDGDVEEGRKLTEIGAHVQGFNAKSIGICLAGGVNKEGKAENNFTQEQFDSLKHLLLDLKLQFPAAKIQGHRDFDGVRKDCPSFDVRDWLRVKVPDLL